jgi:hypothetical protein
MSVSPTVLSVWENCSRNIKRPMPVKADMGRDAENFRVFPVLLRAGLKSAALVYFLRIKAKLPRPMQSNNSVPGSGTAVT